MATAYPGSGRSLYLASSNPLEPVYPVDPIIPNGDYSMGEPLNDAMGGASLQVVFDAAPGVATDIEYDTDPTFLNPMVIDTIPASADVVGVWTTSVLLPGFIRVSNTSGEQINSVVVQKVVANYG